MHPKLHETITTIKTSIAELCAQIIFVFIVPIVLINTGIIPVTYRVLTLVVLVTVLFILLIKEKWTFKMLGFKKEFSLKEVLVYTIFTLLGVLVITQLGEHIGREELTQWWKHPHFLYLFFVVSLFQEMAYRGYLMPALGKITSSPIRIILTNAALFTFLHSIFPNYLINLPLAFIGGIGLALIYRRYPNLILIVICHAVLNFFAVLYGFFMIPGVTY
jgi:membrane protease YdiL (CAAX protease family)